MPFYYSVICLFVRSNALGWGADGESGFGWPEKSSYTVHFPCALIGMSTVKAPPMSRLGGGGRRGGGVVQSLSCAIKMTVPLKSDLYSGQRGEATFTSSMCSVVGDWSWHALILIYMVCDMSVQWFVCCVWVCAGWKLSERLCKSHALTEGHF